MKSKNVNSDSFPFNDEGVEVRVVQPARKLRAVRLPLGALANMPGTPGGFQPGRVVMNIALEYEDTPGDYNLSFDPPFELRVRYTPADLQRAQQANKTLQLAFWDGSKWVVFTQAKHNFQLIPDANGQSGVGVAHIANWMDPNISWGP